jgi:hypothetical protein
VHRNVLAPCVQTIKLRYDVGWARILFNGIILRRTEIMLLVSDEDSAVPIFDTAPRYCGC